MYYTLTQSRKRDSSQIALLAESFYKVLPVQNQAVIFKGG